MKKSIYLASYLFLLFSSIFSTETFGQSLYEDALELATAIEGNQVYIRVEGKSSSKLKRIAWDPYTEDSLSLAYIYLPGRDSFFLQENGQYLLTDHTDSLQVAIHYDTTNLTFLVAPKDTLFINNQNLYLSCNGQDLGKHHVLKVHTLLGTHMDDGGAEVGFAPYMPASLYENYAENPHLGRLIQSGWFEETSWRTEKNIYSASVNTAIQKKKAAYQPLLQKLYADSLSYNQQLLSIKGIQAAYKEPVQSPLEGLTTTANLIESNAPTTSSAFSTATFVAGVSDFITERAQEEFNIVFMERFRERLNDPQYAELQVLFPKSQDFLNQIDIANYKSALLSARQVFVEDIQKLNFNLPKVFELPKYESIQNTPEIYNLLVIYKIMDFIFRDNQMEDILPLTFRSVQERCDDLDRSINLRLAGIESAAADRADLGKKIEAHEQLLLAEFNRILMEQFLIEFQFANGALAESEAIRDSIDLVWSDYQNEMEALNKELFNAWDTVSLKQITANLKGKLFYEQIFEEPNIDTYHKYFDEQPDPENLMAAGIQLSRFMVNGINGKRNKAELLKDWDQLLQQTNAKLSYIENAAFANSNTGLQLKLQALDQRRLDLQQALVDDLVFWEKLNISEHDQMALTYLARTLNDSVFTKTQGESIIENLDIRNARLEYIRETIYQKLIDLAASQEEISPLLLQFTEEGTLSPLTILEPRPTIDSLLEQANSISYLIEKMEKTHADTLLKARNNADVVAKILEMSSHLFLFLQTGEGDERTWLTTNQWNQLMKNDIQRDAYFGLMYQRMKSLYPSRQFSNKGMASITASFVYNLAQLKQHRQTVGVKKARDMSLTFEDYLPFVKIAVNLVNSILETPILLDRDYQAFSLVDRDSAFSFIPQISNHGLNLFENIHDRQYNFAIYNSLELYKIISERTLQNCNSLKKIDQAKCYEQEKIRNAILVYGTFIADIALAQKPEDIGRALEMVALPPGSSRIKRRTPYNISLNSYFGVALGNERLTNSTLLNSTSYNNDFRLNSASLTVPIGVTASWKFKPHHKGSFSFFFPILDLGAVTAFRLSETDNVLPELRFQNLIAPGAHFLYNMPKTPISFGVGTQYGPQLRKINLGNEVYETGAWRILFTASVDVPIFNLFGNRY